MPALRDLGALGGPPRPWLDQYPARVPAHLEYPDQPLGWLLERAANLYPRNVACCYYGEQLTYEELFSRARRFAAVLANEGLQPGDRVGLLLPNLPEYLVALFGTWLAGGIVVSLSPLMVAPEVTRFVNATDCKVIVTLDLLLPLILHNEQRPPLVLLISLASRLSRVERLGYAWLRFRRIGFRTIAAPGTRFRGFHESINNARERSGPGPIDPGAPAYVLPTGGTTGAPKAVTLSHRNLMAQAWQLSHWSHGVPGEETILAVVPFFHSYGLSACVMNGVALGSRLVMHHRFRPASVVRLIQQHRPTGFFAVPAMMAALNVQMLRKKHHDFSSLKVCISGGAPLPPRIAEEFSGRTGCTVVEGYGLSEASPTTHSGPLDGSAVPGTIGLPLPDTDAKIVDAATGTEQLPTGEVGELVVRGPQVMLGYWNNQTETDRVLRDGWLYTGDLATCDDRGFFKIVDRKKDLIITSAFNVYPTDVEAVLRKYPGIQDVAVVGEPDEIAGEIVKAIVVLEPRRKFNRRDFDAFVHANLSAHQRPKIVETRTDDLPRNFLGKVLRRDLRSIPAPAGQRAVSGQPARG
jgi:long-chain acyl-CoA synthetase